MRRLIVGPPNTGKSLLAERLLTGTGKPLGYMATLPRMPSTAGRIARHAARRDGRWWLHEVGDDPLADMNWLGLLVEANRPVLIDGLSYWIECLFERRETRAQLHELCVALRDVLARARAGWVIVDVEWQAWLIAGPYGLAEINASFHEMLTRDLQADVERLGCFGGSHETANPVG